jgi:formylglycine-generating enzyme required for sulfatase activity
MKMPKIFLAALFCLACQGAGFGQNIFTDPMKTDSDGDGVSDYREIKDGTDPESPGSFNSLSKGLIAFYPFNGNSNDESGYGNPAIVYGAEVTKDRFGGNGSAFYFNGSSAYLEAADKPHLRTLPITMSCWFRDQGTPSNEVGLVGKYRAEYWDGYQMVIQPDGKLWPWYVLYRGNDVIGNYEINGDENPPFKSGNVKDGSWHQAVFTVDESGGNLYIDGSKVSSKSWRGDPRTITSNLPLTIGRYAGRDPGFFKGEIDDVRIYKRALSAAEVSQLFSQESKPFNPPVIFENSLYTTVLGPSWADAEANAQKLGGHLVAINTAKENDFLWAEFSDAAKYRIRPNAYDTPEVFSHWIGLTDNATEGDWKWSNGDLLTFINSPGEIPNSYRVDENWGRVTWNAPASWTGNIQTRGFWQDHNLYAYQNGNETPTGIAEIPFVRRGDSIYVIVEGPSWDEAEANAVKLGGHLVTINDANENKWLLDNLTWKGAVGASGVRAYWIGLNDAQQEGDAHWVDGSQSSYRSNGASDYYSDEDWFTLTSTGEWNDLSQTPGSYGMVHWNMKFGIAEIITEVSNPKMITVQGGTLPSSSALAGQSVNAFQISKFETTWGEWKTVRDWAVTNGYSDLAGTGAGVSDSHPVTNVNWFDVVKWCNAKSEMEGLTPVYNLVTPLLVPYVDGYPGPFEDIKVFRTGQPLNGQFVRETIQSGYRLPMEKEWEWAARGGVSSKGYNYSGSNDYNIVAWTYNNSSDGIKAVGTLAANELGIFDMSGNAYEWCWDVENPEPNPNYRRLRGGSYGNWDGLALVSNRCIGYPPGSDNIDISFRVARNVIGDMVTVQGGTLPSSSALAGQTVGDFRIGKYEVTWGEWKTVRDWAVVNGYTDLAGVGGTYPDGAADNFPVLHASWYHAVKWCNARSEMEGLTPVYQVNGATYKTGEVAPKVNRAANGYRLPSEKEWEWAARGGSNSQGYTYSGSNDINAVAWYRSNSSGGANAVGTKAANELGIYDMSGNFWEWCEDIVNSSDRRVRGGGWSNDPDACTLARRDNYSYPHNSTGGDIGFRLARYVLGDDIDFPQFESLSDLGYKNTLKNQPSIESDFFDFSALYLETGGARMKFENASFSANASRGLELSSQTPAIAQGVKVLNKSLSASKDWVISIKTHISNFDTFLQNPFYYAGITIGKIDYSYNSSFINRLNLNFTRSILEISYDNEKFTNSINSGIYNEEGGDTPPKSLELGEDVYLKIKYFSSNYSCQLYSSKDGVNYTLIEDYDLKAKWGLSSSNNLYVALVGTSLPFQDQIDYENNSNQNYNLPSGRLYLSDFEISPLKLNQKIDAFSTIADKFLPTVPFAVTAPTSSSGLPVTISVKSGPATISTTFLANNLVTLTGPGTVVLAANQAGNATYLSAEEVTTSFTVFPEPLPPFPPTPQPPTPQPPTPQPPTPQPPTPPPGGGGGSKTVDWLEKSPKNRQFSMTVYAKVLVDNVLKSNPKNLLAAFDKDGLAGASAPLVEDNGVFALTIWRDANTKEVVDLKFYDAASGRIYCIAEELEFLKDSQAGTLQKPIELVPLYEEVELSINVAKGWNWVSFGVLPARASVERVFGDYSFTDNDLIKGANGFATFFRGKWYPEDFALEAGRMYSVRRQAEGSAVVGVIGGEQDVSAGISLVKGWNWLGYTPGEAKTVGEALASLQAVNGDLIKGQTLGSVTFNNGTWVPGNAQLVPGRGYMLRVEKGQTFRFEQPALAMVNADNSNGEQSPSLRMAANTMPKVLSATLASTTVPDWTAPQGKANNMVVFATVKIDGKDVDAAGSRLAAFDGTQIAGVVEIKDGPTGKHFPLQILTDSADGATILFKAYDAASGKMVDLKETLPFQADGVIARIDTPKPFTYTSPTPTPVAPAPSGGGGSGSGQSEPAKKGKGSKKSSASKSANAKSKSNSGSSAKKSYSGSAKKSGAKKPKNKK